MKALVVSLYTESAPPAVEREREREREREIAKEAPFLNLKEGN